MLYAINEVMWRKKKHLCILLTWNFQGDELLSQFYAKRFLPYDACLIWLHAMHIISHFMPILLYAMCISCLILLYVIEDWYFLQWRECNDVRVGIALEPQCFSSGALGELTLRAVYPALLSTHTSRHFRLQTRFKDIIKSLIFILEPVISPFSKDISPFWGATSTPVLHFSGFSQTIKIDSIGIIPYYLQHTMLVTIELDVIGY